MADNYCGCELYFLVDNEVPLEEVLVEGVILSSARHDNSNPNVHTHWHRRVIETYDSVRGIVVLSLEGSSNSLGNLNILEREFTVSDLYPQDLTIRSPDYEIF